MKKLIPFACMVLLFASCKKSYTCDCSTAWTYKTNSGSYNTQTFPGDKTAYYEKMTEKQAVAACKHQQVTTETNVKNGLTNNGNVSMQGGESIVTDCSIKLD